MVSEARPSSLEGYRRGRAGREPYRPDRVRATPRLAPRSLDIEARDPYVVTKRQRVRQLARQKWERQQARRTERRSRARKRAIVAGAVAGILAIGAGGYGVTLLVKDDRQANAAPTTSPEPEPSAADTPTAAVAPRPTKPGECTFVAQGDADQKSVGVPRSKCAGERCGRDDHDQPRDRHRRPARYQGQLRRPLLHLPRRQERVRQQGLHRARRQAGAARATSNAAT